MESHHHHHNPPPQASQCSADNDDDFGANSPKCAPLPWVAILHFTVYNLLPGPLYPTDPIASPDHHVHAYLCLVPRHCSYFASQCVQLYITWKCLLISRALKDTIGCPHCVTQYIAVDCIVSMSQQSMSQWPALATLYTFLFYTLHSPALHFTLYTLHSLVLTNSSHLLLTAAPPSSPISCQFKINPNVSFQPTSFLQAFTSNHHLCPPWPQIFFHLFKSQHLGRHSDLKG